MRQGVLHTSFEAILANMGENLSLKMCSQMQQLCGSEFADAMHNELNVIKALLAGEQPPPRTYVDVEPTVFEYDTTTIEALQLALRDGQTHMGKRPFNALESFPTSHVRAF